MVHIHKFKPRPNSAIYDCEGCDLTLTKEQMVYSTYIHYS